MTRRLLIVDRYEAPALVALGESPDAARWDVLLLGRSLPWMQWRHPLGRAAAWQWVDPKPFADEVANRVGDFLVNLVRRLPDLPLGGTTLHDLLRSPDGSRWWFMEIAEKGPLRGPLVGQLYRLMLAEAVMGREAYEAIHVQVEERAVTQVFRTGVGRPGLRVELLPSHNEGHWWDRWPALRHWVHAGVGATRAVLVKVWLLVWGTRKAELPGTLSSFTFYPSWWSRPFDSGAADRFFSHLNDSGVSEYLTWISDPLALWRHPLLARRVMRQHGMRILQASTTWRDIAGLLSITRFIRTLRFERSMRPALVARMQNLDVSPLIAAELSRSLTGGEMALGELLQPAVRRSIARAAPRVVLFRTEFQPFECALLMGLRGATAGIGFLHYPFGQHYLSTRFAAGELPEHLAQAGSPTARPFPDGIIACGETGIGHVTASAYPRRLCAPCGPQRFGRLVDYLRAPGNRNEVRDRLGWPRDEPIFFVTLAVVEADTEALFGALALALQSSVPFRLVVRPHPNRPHGDAPLRSALAALGNSRAGLMEPGGDIYDCIRAADAMVCIGSMIAFEAIALGCMPVVFENPSTFPALSLAEFEDSLFVARDDGELRSALQAIAGRKTEDVRRRANWPATLDKVLGDTLAPLPVQMARALAELEVVVP